MPYGIGWMSIILLVYAGRGRMSNVRTPRINRTLVYFENREGFFIQLIDEIQALIKRAEKQGKKVCVRLNGTSDIMWEKQKIKSQGGKTIFEVFPDLQFYDYTKIYTRFDSKLPANYHLTLSRSESNEEKVKQVMKKHPKVNVAVVFSTLSKTYNGRKVYNADESDLRFLDPAGVIAGLIAKGEAKTDTSGFVVA